MSLVKRNIVANYIGSVWTTLMSLIFIPLYIHFMGIEAFGLIGIFIALQAIFSLLDLGLSTTLNREMARLSVQSGKGHSMRDFVRTFELGYWAIALALGLIFVTFSRFIAYHWVNAEALKPETVQKAIMLMGAIIAFRWPLNIYYGGLKGLQRQVTQNIIKAGTATLSGIGAILVLWLISPTIEAFFIWQVFISALRTFLAKGFLWASLPKQHGRARFRLECFKGCWQFAAGITGITIIDVILSQLDKIILSKMLTLEIFGYYTLASVVAMSLFRLSGPIFEALYPRLTNLATLGDQEALVKLYHKSCQLMSVVILPSAIVVAFFSHEILLIWTQNATTADQAYLLVSILIIGSAINGLMNIPYALQLAYAWTKLTLSINIVSLVIFVPYIILMTKYFGIVGAATTWPLLHIFQILWSINLMHRRLIPEEKDKWILKDVGLPFLASLATVGLGRILIGEQMTRFTLALSILGIYTVSVFIVVMITPEIRHLFLNIISKAILYYKDGRKI